MCSNVVRVYLLYFTVVGDLFHAPPDQRAKITSHVSETTSRYSTCSSFTDTSADIEHIRQKAKSQKLRETLERYVVMDGQLLR